MNNAAYILQIPTYFLERAKYQLENFYQDYHKVENVPVQVISEFTEWLGLRVQTLFSIEYVSRLPWGIQCCHAHVLDDEFVDDDHYVWREFHRVMNQFSKFTLVIGSKAMIYILPVKGDHHG